MISFELLNTRFGSTPYEGTYQAEKGMTWTQWCDSKYNTIGANVLRNYVGIDYDEILGDFSHYIGDENGYISPNDIIKNSGTYLLAD